MKNLDDATDSPQGVKLEGTRLQSMASVQLSKPLHKDFSKWAVIHTPCSKSFASGRAI